MSASVFDENIAGGSDVATLSTSDPDLETTTHMHWFQAEMPITVLLLLK